eukprot:m.480083 g.480083  ORF g.480083 m.480083 type:complete len:68 (+) comp21693_c0_seq1:123-326(+)
MASTVQKDWDNREFIETLSAGLKRITEFLNSFDASTRYRLANLNDRVTSLERSLDYIAAKVSKDNTS